MVGLRFLIVGVVVGFGVETPAFAHKLLLEYRVAGELLRVEAGYDDDSPAEGASIVLENERKEIIAQGKTDERGLWSCPLPPPGVYLLRAESVGHAATREVTIGNEIAAARPANEPGTPWTKVLIGIGAIAVLFTAVWLAKRTRSAKPGE